MADDNKNEIAKSNSDLDRVTNEFEVATIQLGIANKFVEYVMNSSLKSNFETRDEQGNKIVNPNDIINCIMLGMELGLGPLSSITYGRTLNGNGYISIKRGRELGLDDVAAMQNIHVWQNKDKLVVYTGVHVISKVLLDNGVKIDILEDAIPLYKYKDLKTPTKIYDELNNDMIVVNNNTKPEDLKDALAKGKTPVSAIKYDVKTTVKLTRVSKGQEITISYTLKQATNAGLYKGINDDGEKVDGKANWNNHPETHLRGRCITIGGRIIVADKLNGIYSIDEASEIKEAKVIVEDISHEELKD